MTDPLPQLVRDLMRLGVGLEVENGGASFTLPRDEPRRSKAEKAVRSSLPLVRDHRDEFLAVWQSVAVDEAEPQRCVECRAWIFSVPRVVTWAFCESLYCPYRSDPRATDAKDYRRRQEWKRKQEAPPIPD